MKVLFVTSEVFPLAKTGGLADACCALAKSICAIGAKVSVAIPLYRCIEEGEFNPILVQEDIPVSLNQENLTADIYKTTLSKGIDCILVKRDEFYDRTYLYATPKSDYFDNAERFIFLCKYLNLAK